MERATAATECTTEVVVYLFLSFLSQGRSHELAPPMLFTKSNDYLVQVSFTRCNLV